MARRSPRKHVSVQIKDKAVQVLAVAGGLFIASLVFGGSSSPILKAAATGFRMPVGFVLVLGGLLWVIGHLLRADAQKKPALPAVEPEFFPNVPRPPGVRPLPQQSTASIADATRSPASSWSPQVFQDIEWKRFETLCAQLFAQAGFEAKTQSHGADGGVDIWLHSRNAAGPVAIVQCKHWPNRLVGVKEVRELLGVMASHKLARGTFATSGGFTQEAQRFAQDSKIHVLDGGGLLALIAKRTPEQQQALLQHAYEGEYWRPSCASCGSRLVERNARKQGTGFWGCPSYPRCKFTLPMRTT
ncbi:MAG: restriction endonuclease [Ramlibacter sp.]